MLHAIIATYRFRHKVAILKNDDVEFSAYLHVPEIDPETKALHHERADHGHLLKRLACLYFVGMQWKVILALNSQLFMRMRHFLHFYKLYGEFYIMQPVMLYNLKYQN